MTKKGKFTVVLLSIVLMAAAVIACLLNRYVDRAGSIYSVSASENSTTMVPIFSECTPTVVQNGTSVELHGREYIDTYVTDEIGFSYSVGYFITNCIYEPNDISLTFSSPLIESHYVAAGFSATSFGASGTCFQWSAIDDDPNNPFFGLLCPKFDLGLDSWDYSFYFTITDKAVDFSYALSFGVGNINDYQDSRENIVCSYAKGTTEYEEIYKYYLSENATVTLTASGGDIDNEGNQSCEFTIVERMTVEKYMEIPVKEGYTFTGWYYDEECTQKYNGEPITDDTILYAGFEINKYTVTYYAGAPTLDPNEAGQYDRVDAVEYGQAADYMPEIEGETFLGWYYENGVRYENDAIIQNTVLYGKWLIEEYTVTFDWNGGVSDSGTEMTLERGAVPILPTVIREGYEFVGWLDISDSSVTGKHYELGPITNNLSLRAIWKRNVFTVTLYADGEIFKQLSVEYGKTLYEAIDENAVDCQKVVSYCNINIVTPAVAFREFVVEDDMAVYLDGLSLDDNSGHKDVWTGVKDFFENYWVLITVSGVAVVVFVAAVVVMVRRKR